MNLLPHQIESRLSDDQLRQLSEKGFLRVEGVGMYRKADTGITFEAFEFEGIVEESGIVEASRLADEVPAWMIEGKKKTHHEALRSKVSQMANSDLPVGRTQQRVLEERKQRHQQQQKEEMKSKSRSRDLGIFGIASLLALCLLLVPFWLVDDGDTSLMDVVAGSDRSIQEVASLQNTSDLENGVSESAEIGSSADSETETTPEKILEEPRPKDAAYSTASERERIKAEQEKVKSKPAQVVEKSPPPKPAPSTEKVNDSPKNVPETVAVAASGLAQTAKEGDNVGRQYAIVVASMKSMESAQKMTSSFKSKGYAPEIVSSPVKGQTYYRVLLGRFDERGAALESQKALGGEYWVTRLTAGSKLLSADG